MRINLMSSPTWVGCSDCQLGSVDDAEGLISLGCSILNEFRVFLTDLVLVDLFNVIKLCRER